MGQPEEGAVARAGEGAVGGVSTEAEHSREEWGAVNESYCSALVETR